MNAKQVDFLAALKADGEDFEWYPTTEAMLDIVAASIGAKFCNRGASLLDIGAGDGRTFGIIDRVLKDDAKIAGHSARLTDCYAIEKAQKLISSMPSDVVIIGTDFLQQTLIDKEVDVIFCNPPYSEFETWAERIITEANAQHAYLIIPRRWKESAGISEAIARRKAVARVLHSTDFLNAERSARAVVDIVHVDFTSNGRGYREESISEDPFSIWFDEHFPIKAAEKEANEFDESHEKQSRIGDLVAGRNPVIALAELYRADMQKLMENYKAVGKLDADVLRELGVSTDGLKKGLKQKIKGLKCLYWKELFGHLDAITNRLTSETRKKMLKRLNTHTTVDFTESNAYAIIIWAIKNANIYMDSQLVDLYKKMTCEQNATAYKSNRHMTKDTWRCLRWGWHHEDENAPKHYALEYRIVLEGHSAIDTSQYGWEAKNNLSNTAHDYIGDVFAVAGNMGFKVHGSSLSRLWESNEAQDFFTTKNGEDILFASIRAFKNGNIHIKFNQDFMRTFNVEAGRLLGWIKSPKDAAEEMGITRKVAEEAWGNNFKITGTPLLPAASAA